MNVNKSIRCPLFRKSSMTAFGLFRYLYFSPSRRAVLRNRPVTLISASPTLITDLTLPTTALLEFVSARLRGREQHPDVLRQVEHVVPIQEFVFLHQRRVRLHFNIQAARELKN